MIVAQVAFTYLPPLQGVFDTRPVALGDGMLMVAPGVALLVIVGAEKRIAAWFGADANRPGRAAERQGA